VKEDEMGSACGTNGGEKECIWDICGKARRKETTRKSKKYLTGNTLRLRYKDQPVNAV
jgi:hypothetical protein